MPARILIVDDTPASAKVLAAKLTAEYYDVLVTESGAEALVRASEDDPDIVLLDVMMPEMHGFEVCRRLKSDGRTAHIPVVIVTALGGREDRIQGLAAGADEFLTKPVDDTTLMARVRSLLRLKQMLDQWRLRQETGQRMGLVEDTLPMLDDGRGARIVVVGGAALENTAIEQMLSSDGDIVTVINTEAGSELEQQIAGDQPDVIVLAFGDEADPTLRLASTLRSLEPMRQIPIVTVGDEIDMPDMIKALELGVNDYIIRPLDDQELLARIRTQVRRKRYQDRLRDLFLSQLSLALTDSLTGLHNRRYLDSHLEGVMQRMTETGRPVTLLMIDIDHFKAVNDTHGHAVGDEVLATVAERILRNVRGFDLAVRYGGEEFVVVMPDTDLDVALPVAERLRERMAEGPVPVEAAVDTLTVTLSIGVAQSRDETEGPSELLKRADQALYAAKNGGRNRVVSDPPRD